MIMRFLRRSVFIVLAAVLLVGEGLADSDSEKVVARLTEVNNRIISGLVVLKANGALDAQGALSLIQTEASSLMDFNKLTRQAMGKHWRKADDTIRTRIIDLFRVLLEVTYAKVFAKYSGQIIKVIEAKTLVDGDIAVIMEVSDGSKAAEIEYTFSPNEDGEYLVGNIKVEGISLIANYRRQFSKIISAKGVEGLAEKLESMTASYLPK